MEDLFIKLKIINDLSKIILKCLTKSQINLLKNKLEKIRSEEIVIHDPKLIVNIKELLSDKYLTFEICSEYGNLEIMKWLYRNKYPYNIRYLYSQPKMEIWKV